MLARLDAGLAKGGKQAAEALRRFIYPEQENQNGRRAVQADRVCGLRRRDP